MSTLSGIFLIVYGLSAVYGLPGLKPRCAALQCATPKCSNPFTPTGECCPVCQPNCAAVQCAVPDCLNPVTPPGECCPVCPEKLYCVSGGNVYHDGQQFKSDCNTCTCDKGQIICTLIQCDAPKPGICPRSIGFGICVELCTTDSSCPGDQKCCSTGCGHTCQSPVDNYIGCFYKGLHYKHKETFKDDCNTCTCRNGNVDCTGRTCLDKPCFYKGLYYKHGEAFKDDCNKCTCRNGNAECTRRTCVDKRCFYKGLYYKHRETFRDDCNTCTCRNGNVECTSRTCVAVCVGVICPQLRCARQHTPPGQCCPRCLPVGPEPDICVGVVCSRLNCARQYTPPGQCCPRCLFIGHKQDCSSVACPAVSCEGHYKKRGECCSSCPVLP